MVLATSVLFGQFNFFLEYLRRMGEKFFGKNESSLVDPNQRKTIHLALFASGTGTNAQKIIDHFRGHPFIRVQLLLSNKPDAGALTIAQKEHLPSLIIEREKFFRGNGYVDDLRSFNIDLIVLAGFLWKLPSTLVSAWNHRIINIHPALLPKYGGKGLYGNHVHEAVIRAGEKESGITIHYVDEIYDHGEPIFQEKVLIEEGDTPDLLARKVQALEHLHFPKVIEEVVNSIWNK
jgi:formyltetrahydrofolate-dependent phosphoribosylglycinamide formyltransferase